MTSKEIKKIFIEEGFQLKDEFNYTEDSVNDEFTDQDDDLGIYEWFACVTNKDISIWKLREKNGEIVQEATEIKYSLNSLTKLELTKLLVEQKLYLKRLKNQERINNIEQDFI